MFSKSTYNLYNVLEAFKLKVSKQNLVKDARKKYSRDRLLKTHLENRNNVNRRNW